MSPAEGEEMRTRLFELERKIQPLAWDCSRNQINEFKKLELERLQAEHTALLEKFKQLPPP